MELYAASVPGIAVYYLHGDIVAGLVKPLRRMEALPVEWPSMPTMISLHKGVWTWGRIMRRSRGATHPPGMVEPWGNEGCELNIVIDDDEVAEMLCHPDETVLGILAGSCRRIMEGARWQVIIDPQLALAKTNLLGLKRKEQGGMSAAKG